MESKEKFYLLKVLVITESKQYKHSCELHNLEKHEHISIQDCVSDIEKDLDRLEKYDKAKQIIIDKEVNFLLLVDCKQVKSYNCCVLDRYKLTQEELDLLKEVFR